MNLYVGNLPYEISDEDIRGLFEPHGEVSSVSLIKDRETGRMRGFGFVEMPNDMEAQAAIQNLDGTEYKGRVLKVNQAKPREERGGGGRGGYGGQRRGGGRGGDRGRSSSGGGGRRRDEW